MICMLGLITVLAVSSYEAYWLYGLYTTNRESVIPLIRASIAKAEIEDFSGRLLKKRNQVDSVVVSKKKSDISAKVISMSMDSLKAKPKHINIFKLNDPKLNKVVSRPTKPNLKEIGSRFHDLMKEADLDIEYELVYIDDAKRKDTLSNAIVNSHSASYDNALSIESSVYDGRYIFSSSTPISLYILNTMTGTLVISIGILLIIIAAFLLMSRTMNRQRELDEMKSDFTRNMTHELKTPIAIAYAASDTLLDCGLGNNPVKREEYLTVIKDQLEKLEGMVEMILSTSMENRNNIRLNRVEQPVKPVLDSVASQIKLKADKECDISVSVTPDNLSVLMDVELMSTVFLTIIDNAIKYSKDSVNIAVKAYPSNDRVVVSIADNGIGIGPKDIQHIFDKFFRVSSGDRHDVKGYGIGLFFAKGIVEKHGGSISVKSQPGKGSTFIIEL